jgi:hypothetical protein
MDQRNRNSLIKRAPVIILLIVIFAIACYVFLVTTNVLNVTGWQDNPTKLLAVSTFVLNLIAFVVFGLDRKWADEKLKPVSIFIAMFIWSMGLSCHGYVVYSVFKSKEKTSELQLWFNENTLSPGAPGARYNVPIGTNITSKVGLVFGAFNEGTLDADRIDYEMTYPTKLPLEHQGWSQVGTRNPELKTIRFVDLFGVGAKSGMVSLCPPLELERTNVPLGNPFTFTFKARAHSRSVTSVQSVMYSEDLAPGTFKY